MNYFQIYDKLYSIGYHSKGKNHGKKYVAYLINNYHFDNVLEVGCSNGLAVHKMFKGMKTAYGMDVSEIAIRYCGEVSYTPNCVLGSADDIPFKDNFFDAVFSCDVLEHLTEEDVFKALEEIARVSKRYLFVVLDCKPEGNREWINKAKVEFPNEFEGIDNLHVTIWDEQTWKKNIRKAGFKFVTEKEGLYVFEK